MSRFIHTMAKFHFEPPVEGLVGIGKLMVDFLLVIIENFRYCSHLLHYKQKYVEVGIFEGGRSHYACMLD